MTGGAGTGTRRLPIAPAWSNALAVFRAAALAEGRRPSTVTRIQKEMENLSRACGGLGPWDLDAETIEAWVESGDRTPARQYVLRTSARTFYRWATMRGFVLTDPTEYVSKLQRPKRPRQSWVAAIEAYRRYLRVSATAPSTIAIRVYQLTGLSHEVGKESPWDVELEDLIEWMSGHRWARETARQNRGTLRSFYGWGLVVGRIDHNPALALPRVSVRPPAPRPASEEAYAAARGSSDARTVLMLRLAAEMGLRRAEVACVHSNDLQEGADGWWLSVRGKGARVRTLPVPPDLTAALRVLPAGWAFPGRQDGHLSPQRVGIIVAEKLPPGVTMHALRHRFATRAYAVDRDVFTVQQLLGHASPTTTRLYVETPSADLRRLVDAVAR